MADTIREQVIQALKGLVEHITAVNGYNTNVGNAVYRGLVNADMESTGALSFIFPGQDAAEPHMGAQILTMPVEVAAIHSLWTKDNDGNIVSYNASILGEEILGDLIRAVVGGRDDINIIEDLAYTGGGISDYPAPEDQVLWVQANFEVVYAITIGDPYSQP